MPGGRKTETELSHCTHAVFNSLVDICWNQSSAQHEFLICQRSSSNKDKPDRPVDRSVRLSSMRPGPRLGHAGFWHGLRAVSNGYFIYRHRLSNIIT